MLSILLRALAPLSSSYAPQLLVGLVICGATSLVVSDHRLAVVAFLTQRLIVTILLWPLVGDAFGIASLIALIAATLVSGGTEWSVRHAQRRRGADVQRDRPFAMTTLFRALAVALVLLVSHGLVQAHTLPWLPQMVAFAVVWLIAVSLLSLLLASSGLGTGLGVLTFADGCRVLYALGQPSLLVWGLWTVCDVLVALAASYLRSIAAMARDAEVES